MLRAFALIAVHVVAIVHFAHWRTTGRTVTPLEPSEAMQTLELGYVNAGFVVLVGSIVLTLILGRWFCGWLCHFVAYQDLCAWILRKVGLKPRPVRSRLLALIPLAAAFYMFLWPSIRRVVVTAVPAPELTAHFETYGFWDTFPGPWMAVITVLVGGFLLVVWLGAKGFCTYGCPYGAFFGIVDRFAPFRIKVDDSCETCGHCTTVCSSNVRVHEEVARYRMVVDPGCMKTMDCVRSCPKDALSFGFAIRPLRAKTRRWSTPAADFSWFEEIGMAIVGFGAFFVWRGIYGVPFLLALSLGVCFAIAMLTVWRLVRGINVRFQNFTLRSQGRYTRHGVMAIGIAVVLLAVTVHTAFVHLEYLRAEQAWERAAAVGPQDASRETHLADCSSHLRRSLDMGFALDTERTFMLARAERYRRRYAEAESAVRQTLALRPDLPPARFELAELLAFQGRLEEGERILRALAAERPDFAPARARIAEIDAHRARGR
ncbi:MAG: 4Fe-4S binding protein [Planctomycetota bacterium]